MINETKTLLQRTGENTLLCECNEDFILPDYMPEIRKVLRLDTALSPEEPLLRAGEAEWEGKLLYKLLYTDESGMLTEAPLESRYRGSMQTGGKLSAITSAETVESVSFRPSGPRKISIRAKVRIDVGAYTEEEAQPSLSRLLPEGVENYELLPAEQTVCKLYSVTSEALEAEIAVKYEGMDADSLRVLFSQGDILVENASAEEGRLLFYGTLFPHAVMQSGEERPFVIAKRIPFEAEVSCEEAMRGDGIMAVGLFDSMEIACEETGEDTELILTLHYRIRAEGRRNETLTYVKDLYSTVKDVHIRERAVTGHSFVGAYTGTATVDGEDADPTLLEGEVLHTALSLRESRIRSFGDKAILEGELRADLLTATEDGTINQSFTFPFRIEAPLGAVCTETDTLHYVLRPVYATGNISDGRRLVDGEMAVTVCAERDLSLTLPEEIKESDTADAQKDNILHVYYPKSDDSLWSVAKQYRLPLSKLMTQNGMAQSDPLTVSLPKSLDGYAWLFVSDI